MITSPRFSQLAAEARPRLERQALILSGNSEDAQDLVQNALIKAARSFDQYDDSRSFLNWSLRILQRCFLDDRRHRRRRIAAASFEAIMSESDTDLDTFEVCDPKVNILDDYIRSERASEMIAVIRCLPDNYRDALYKNLVEGLSYEEIAAEQCTSIGTVRSRIFRARKILVQRLEESPEAMTI